MKYSVQFYSNRPTTKPVDETKLSLEDANKLYQDNIQRFFSDCERGYSCEIALWESIFGDYETAVIRYSNDDVITVRDRPMIVVSPNLKGYTPK